MAVYTQHMNVSPVATCDPISNIEATESGCVPHLYPLDNPLVVENATL